MKTFTPPISLTRHRAGRAVIAACVSGVLLLTGCTTPDKNHADQEKGSGATSASGDSSTPPSTDADFGGAPISYNSVSNNCFTPDPISGDRASISVRNSGSVAADIYLVAEKDDERTKTPDVYAELRHIGPSSQRIMRVSLPNGKYRILCAVEGVEITSSELFEVSGSSVKSAAHVPAVGYNEMQGSTDAYNNWVKTQLPVVLTSVGALRKALDAHDAEAARREWKKAHHEWRLVGGMRADLEDAADDIDGIGTAYPTEDYDSLGGFEQVEHYLWAGDLPHASTAAEELEKNIKGVQDNLDNVAMRTLNMNLRVHEVLEETQRFVLTGRSDFGSHTTADMVVADIEATQKLLEVLRPLVEPRLPAVQDAGVPGSRGGNLTYSDLTNRLSNARTQIIQMDHSALGDTPLDQWPKEDRDQLKEDRDQLNALISGSVEDLAPLAAFLALRRTQ